MMSTLLYSQVALPSNAIRLLHLRDDGSRYGTDVVGTISIASLLDKPRFDALSYVWGKRSQHVPKLVCGTAIIDLTENCYAALWHLRRKLGEVTIWVDAICIDQHNEVEKSKQIALMESIYTDAKHVYVWLGFSTPATRRAMIFLSYGVLGAEFNHYQKYSTITRRTLFKVYARPSMVTVRCRPPSHQTTIRVKDEFGIRSVSLTDLAELLDNPWMKRIWTFQEMFLANNPILICGLEHAEWQRFSMSTIFLDNMCVANDHPHVRGNISEWAIMAMNKAEHEKTQSRPARPNISFVHYSDPEHAADSPLLERYCEFLWQLDAKRLSYRQWWGGIRLGVTVGAIFSVLIWPWLLISPKVKLENVLPCMIMSGLALVASAFAYLVSYGWVGPFKAVVSKTSARFEPVKSGEYVISAAFERKATEPKDMLLGMRCILERVRLRNGFTRRCRVSAFGAIESYFKELTLCLVSIAPSYDILLAAAICHMPRCQSWIPDWANASRKWNFDVEFSAALPDSWPNDRSFVVCDDHILAEGVIIREITEKYPFELVTDITSISYRTSRQNILTISNLFQESYVSHSAISVSFQNELISYLRDSAPIDVLRLIDKIWLTEAEPRLPDIRTLTYLVKLLGNVHRVRKWVGELANEFHDGTLSLHNTELLSIVTTICNHFASSDMQVFRCTWYPNTGIKCTSDHEYRNLGRGGRSGTNYPGKDEPCDHFGLCRKDAEVGDEIVLFQGVPVPLVLRPRSISPHHARRHIICPAVVLGIMDGQAWCDLQQPTDHVFTRFATKLPIYID